MLEITKVWTKHTTHRDCVCEALNADKSNKTGLALTPTPTLHMSCGSNVQGLSRHATNTLHVHVRIRRFASPVSSRRTKRYMYAQGVAPFKGLLITAMECCSHRSKHDFETAMLCYVRTPILAQSVEPMTLLR
jgi:hypothetical protein